MKEGSMTYGTRKIKDFILNPNNPRKISKRQLDRLKQSIQDLPQMMYLRPVIINNEGVVLGGNMRLKALAELGHTEVPYIQIEDLTPDQEQEFIVKDNISFGDWDMDILKSKWDMTLLEKWGLETGFTNETVQPIQVKRKLKQIVLEVSETDYDYFNAEFVNIQERECLNSYLEVVTFLLNNYKSQKRVYGKD